MRFIDADDPVVADLLAALLELVAEAGGWLHPEARLVAREGELSLHCTAPDGDPLVSIPGAVMVPVGRITWVIDDGMLRIEDVPDDLSDHQRESLLLMTGILNQCDKATRIAMTHPALAPDMEVSLVDAVRAFRPSFRRVQPSVPGLLWSTRCFGATAGIDEAVAVPVIDMLNHSCAGASAVPQPDRLTVAVRRTGDECFLDYGHRRDAIGMAVVYGFSDTSAVVAHSAPLDVEIPRLGRVKVLARGRNSSGALSPVTARTDEGATVLNRFTFGPESAPAADLARATDWSTQQAASVVEAVSEANLALLAHLQRTAEPFALAGGVAERTLAEAATIQMRLIEESAT